MEAVLIIGNDIDLSEFNFINKYVIGIDKGAVLAYNYGIKLDLAIGDFDSINESEFQLVSNWTTIIKLNSVKDDTDTNHALKYCQNATKITILGGIQGKRIEHFLANLILITNDKRIEILDNNSKIFTIDSNYAVDKSIYKYISLYALEEVKELNLIGFKYKLEDYNLKINDPLCISNELVEEKGVIQFKEGRVLVILSKLDR